MHIIPLFPSLIFFNRVEVPENLVSYCLELRDHISGVEFSNRGGWQSPSDLHLKKDFCDNFLTNFINELKDNQVFPNFEIDNCWININEKGNHNVFHNHPNCDYSLVWYIKTPNNCGDIIFENPESFSQNRFLNVSFDDVKERYNAYYSYKFRPMEGNCYIFPPGLRHLVETNQSEECRISMSCNLKFL